MEELTPFNSCHKDLLIPSDLYNQGLRFTKIQKNRRYNQYKTKIQNMAQSCRDKRKYQLPVK